MPDTTPKVSVGLPVFNAERYLPVSLDAPLSQTLTDFELIISDNGSTDGTEAMYRAWAGRDPRVPGALRGGHGARFRVVLCHNRILFIDGDGNVTRRSGGSPGTQAVPRPALRPVQQRRALPDPPPGRRVPARHVAGPLTVAGPHQVGDEHGSDVAVGSGHQHAHVILRMSS